jgi:hypothetical protein
MKAGQRQRAKREIASLALAMTPIVYFPGNLAPGAREAGPKDHAIDTLRLARHAPDTLRLARHAPDTLRLARHAPDTLCPAGGTRRGRDKANIA